MNHLVKLLTDDDGAKYPNKKWHYVVRWDGSSRTLCTGECFGIGEGRATFDTKDVEKGGITCEECMEIIKEMKAIKL